MNSYSYQEIEVGWDAIFQVTITESMMEHFLTITGDRNPLHLDTDYAISRKYEGKVVYGMLTASLLSTLVGVYLPGKNSLIHGVEIKFNRPVYIKDTISVRGIVEEKHDGFKMIILKVIMTNQNNERVCRAKMRVGVLDE